MQNLLKLISPKEKSTAVRQMKRRAYTLQSLSRCPEIDKPTTSKAQDAKHTVFFPVVDGSATGAGRTVEQIGPFFLPCSLLLPSRAAEQFTTWRKRGFYVS